MGRVTSATDALGGVTLTEYDENGNAVKVTNADGGVTTYVYDLLGRLTGYTDTEGYTFGFTYDANGNVRTSTDGRGNTASTEYDALNRPVKQTDQAGNPSRTEYDADGRVIRTTDYEGAVTNYWYDKNGKVVKATDALGNAASFTYDSMGRVSAMTDALGAVTAYTYTAAGQVETVTDALGGARTYGYDLLGRLVKASNELGETTQYTYDALGRVLTVADPLGNADKIAYGATGRITSVTDKNGNATVYKYDANGNIIETVDALGHSSYFEYDAMDRLVKATFYRIDGRHNVNEAQATLYSYDKRGLVTKEVNAAGDGALYVYDGNGNMVQETDADGYVTSYGYDPRNLVEAINYSGGKEVQFAYDRNGALIAMMDWNGTVSFSLDLLGRITSVNDQNEKTTGCTYDAVGNRTSIKYPDGTTASYKYDLLGRPASLTDAEKQTTLYQYDAASRPIYQAYPNGWKDAYQYDAAGRLLRQFTTDPSGAPNKAIESAYTYDANGNVLTEYRDGALAKDGLDSSMHGMGRYNLTHTYDALDRLTGTTGDKGYAAHTYEYDSLGNLVYEKDGNGANKGNEYWYNDLNEQVQKKVDNKDTYAYTYDKRGNLVQGVYQKNQNSSTVVESYVYDATNRMVKGTNEAGEESHYIYNGLGYLIANEWIIQKNNYGYTGVDTAPSEQVGGVVVCDRHKNTTGLGHIDPKGKGHTTGGTEGGAAPTIGGKYAVIHKDYTLDYASPLKNTLMEQESGASGLTYRYTYGLGKNSVAITGIPNGVGSVAQYAYDGDAGEFVLTQEDPGQNVMGSSIVKLWYHRDRLGSTAYLTNNVNGDVGSFAGYDDWGAPTMKAVLRIGARELDPAAEYTGHPYDPVLGVYYARARMYDAADRRFMSVDPVKGEVKEPATFIQYIYALNNPILMLDPTGMLAVCNYGDSGKDVNDLQVFLNRYGYFSTRQVITSGYFGQPTTEALIRFQLYYMGRSWDDLFPFNNGGRYIGCDIATVSKISDIIIWENSVKNSADYWAIDAVEKTIAYKANPEKIVTPQMVNPSSYFYILSCGVFDKVLEDQIRLVYELQSDDARLQYLLGTNKLTSDAKYESPAEAEVHQQRINISIWVLDKKTGSKTAGSMILRVNSKVALTVARVFSRIFIDSEQFPIKASDTYGYGWRDTSGDPTKFSEHAHGIAIDINSDDNAMYNGSGRIVAGSRYEPQTDPFSITPDGSVVRAFKEYGWGWGGEWRSSKDYMHFSWVEDTRVWSANGVR